MAIGQRMWTEEEDAWLREANESMTIAEMAEHLGRSMASINGHRRLLGIGFTGEALSWRRLGERNANWKGGVSKDYTRYSRIYRARYPDHARARSKLSSALRRGDIERQPCVVCGNPKSDGHHDDYSKPLEVVWLCRKHHKQRHLDMGMSWGKER